MYVSYFQLKETEVVRMAPKSSDGKAESMPFNFTVTERGLNSDVPRPHGYTWTPKKPTNNGIAQQVNANVPKQFPTGLPVLPKGIGAPLATSTPTGRKYIHNIYPQVFF